MRDIIADLKGFWKNFGPLFRGAQIFESRYLAHLVRARQKLAGLGV